MNKTHQAVVEGLSHDGRGVVKHDGKVYFVPQALPGEKIEFEPFKKRRGQFSGKLVEVMVASPHRIQPECEYFGTCGGCSLQHLSADQQLFDKQKTLVDSLVKIGKVAPENILSSVTGDVWHYRRKARPGVKYVPKKGGVLVGFREPGSHYLTSLRHCKTLDRRLSGLLDPIHDLVSKLSCYQQIPQIEFAAADNATALVLRHLQPLLERDLDFLRDFAQQFQVHLYLQPKGLDSVYPLWPVEPEPLFYLLPQFDLHIEFSATDFVQINGQVNEALIDLAVTLLEPSSSDRVLDLFCGLGNFTLPLAMSGAEIVGVEGEQTLVNKGINNAKLNQIDNVEFKLMDLFGESIMDLGTSKFTKVLLDPPRSGALNVVTDLMPKIQPRRIVYVSCNPSTLARDAGILVHQHEYRLTHAGVIDMFPHTAHVESIAVFENTKDL